MSATPGRRSANGIPNCSRYAVAGRAGTAAHATSAPERAPVGIGGVGVHLDLLLVAAPDVDGPQPRAGIPARIAPEHDDPAVRAEGRPFRVEAVDQDALARTVGFHRADLEVAVGLARIGDEIALGRPHRRRVRAFTIRNTLRAAAAGIHHIELRLPATIGLEHDS